MTFFCFLISRGGEGRPLGLVLTKRMIKILLRQLRLLYTKSNRLLRLFYHCSTDVKIALFCSYCTCFYCPFLWTHYKKSTHSYLRVAFNNVYRRILKLPPRSSASTMCVINNIDIFEVFN